MNVSRQLRDDGLLIVMRRVEAVGNDSRVFLRGVPVDILWKLRWRGIVDDVQKKIGCR